MKYNWIMVVVCVISSSALATPLFAQSDVLPLLPHIGPLSPGAVHVESFDHEDAWEHYSSPDGTALRVESGTYRAFSMTPGYVWGVNAILHSDVVIKVELTPLTTFQDNAAGIMCRADTTNKGDGYYFMVNANGYYSLQLWQGDEITALVDWQPSEAVRSGIDRNTITALCVGDNLAMYVNDVLVAHVIDETYASGYAGLAVAAGDNGVNTSFDNLILYEVRAS